MPVGGEGARFDDDFDSIADGPVEARQHQVQVHRQRVHGDDFIRPGPRQVRKSRGQILVIRNPGARGGFVARYGQACPVIELLVNQPPCCERHQPKRMTAQI